MPTVTIVDINLTADFWVVDCLAGASTRFNIQVPRTIINADNTRRSPTQQDFLSALQQYYTDWKREVNDDSQLETLRVRFVGKQVNVT